MNERNRPFLVVMSIMGLVFLVTLCALGAFMYRSANNPMAEETRKTPRPSSTVDPMDPTPYDPMEDLAMFGTQTAVAMLGRIVPAATLLPNQQYWSPLTNDSLSPYFTYDSTQWARTDVRTLASLQTSGCTLRVAGGHALGPGWTTQESSLQVADVPFITVLASYEGTPQFITYSLENGTVFEIASATDFTQCQQAGEAILKTMIVN